MGESSGGAPGSRFGSSGGAAGAGAAAAAAQVPVAPSALVGPKTGDWVAVIFRAMRCRWGWFCVVAGVFLGVCLSLFLGLCRVVGLHYFLRASRPP